MQPAVEATLKHLRADYPVKTAFLYGSFANGTATAEGARKTVPLALE